jgi:hypothetical protein
LFCIHVGKFLVTTSLILSVRKLTLISYWVGDETYIFVIVYTITILNLTILNATLKVDIDQIKVKSLLFLDFSCSIFIIKLRTSLWMWSNGGTEAVNENISFSLFSFWVFRIYASFTLVSLSVHSLFFQKDNSLVSMSVHSSFFQKDKYKGIIMGIRNIKHKSLIIVL